LQNWQKNNKQIFKCKVKQRVTREKKKM